MGKVENSGRKLSPTYRMLRRMGLNYSEEEYGDVSIFKVIGKALGNMRREFLMKYMMNLVILTPINPRKFRPMVLRWIGCNVGKGVFVGPQVMVDSGNASLITIEEGVHIAARCILLCHQRDLSDYKIGDDYAKLKYRKSAITLKKGCLIAMNSMIMPGVTIGEGAIVGAYSLVTRDIPPWTIATGRPAKVVKHIAPRENPTGVQ
ncbi:MAG: acyltransferase [Alistipes sp.]|nr:acyltransferase [Alistipes sp.]